jgi:hypothetical protein
MINFFQRATILVGFLFLSIALSFAQQQVSVSTFVADPSTSKEYHAYDGSLALIVGIDGYLQGESRRSSVSSAKGFKELLMSHYGFQEKNIIILLDDQARRSVILTALKKLQRKSPNDRVLVFLSGRGYTDNVESRNERGYFIPFDGVIQSPEQAASTCIPLDDVKRLLSAIGAKQILMLLDFTVGGLPVVKRFSSIPPLRIGFGRIVTSPVGELMAAGDRTETIADDPVNGLSIFTSKLIEALSSELTDVNSDGIITGTEMAAQTSMKVSSASDRKIHPQFGFLDEGNGDYLFILPDAQGTSRISFTFRPTDAILFLDDKQMKSPTTRIPVVSPRIGIHSFQFQHEGYQSIREDFFVNGRVSLAANIDLPKIQTSDLLVRTSEPDAIVYVDGKFFGISDQSPLIKRIAKGTHKVRADLDGYFSDSATVTVEEPIQYAVNLKLRSRNGFLTIRSSEGVVIELDEKEIGMKEFVKKKVFSGQHTVRLSGIGYDAHTQTIVVQDTTHVEYVHRMSRPSLTGALIRSAVFPGWGQSYSRRRGIFYSAIFVGLAAASVDLQLTYTKTSKDYTESKRLLDGASAADIATYQAQAASLSSKKDKENLYRFAAFGVTAGFYLYNIINVWRNDPADMIREEEAKAKREKGGTKVSLGFNELGPAVMLSLQF